MRKFLVFMLVAVLAFTVIMSGCTNTNDNMGMSGSSNAEMNSKGSVTGSGSATKPGSMINSAIDNITGKDDNNGSSSGMNSGSNGSMNGSGSISSGSMSSVGSAGTDNSSGAEENVTSKGIFMFNSKVYNVTDERVETDKVGEMLMAISSGVSNTPAKDGEALGLDNGTRVYRIKDSQDDKEVAVELNGKYFRASQNGTNA